MAALEHEAADGQARPTPVVVDINLFNALSPQSREVLREGYSLRFIDSKHHFPWTEPGRRYEIPKTNPPNTSELTEDELRILAKARGISLEPTHFLPHPHLSFRHAG